MYQIEIISCVFNKNMIFRTVIHNPQATLAFPSSIRARSVHLQAVIPALGAPCVLPPTWKACVPAPIWIACAVLWSRDRTISARRQAQCTRTIRGRQAAAVTVRHCGHLVVVTLTPCGHNSRVEVDPTQIPSGHLQVLQQVKENVLPASTL